MPINNQWWLAYMHSVNVAKHNSLWVMFCHINRWQTLACRTKANVTQIGVYTWQTLGLIWHSKLESLWSLDVWGMCCSWGCVATSMGNVWNERSIDECAQKSRGHFKDRDPRETTICMQNAMTVADDDCRWLLSVPNNGQQLN